MGLIGVLALALGITTRTAAAAPPNYSCTPAFGSASDPRIVDLSFAAVDPARGPGRARVMLPSDYSTSTAAYPVLYLLHGAGDDPCAWSTPRQGQPSLEQFTAAREALGEKVIIVMPDSGGGDGSKANQQAGWYSDWFNAGAFGAPAWESFHLDTLVPFVERTFRAQAGRNHRVVAGLSMGGFGALSYAARHPEMFAAAYSFSGADDTTGIPFLEPAALAALHNTNNTPQDAVWGSFQDQEVRWRGHDPADLVANLRNVALWFTTGHGVAGGPAPDDGDAGGLATEAAVGSMNDVLDAQLTLAGVAHHYEPYNMGGHNWYHWHDDLHRAWVFPGTGIIAALGGGAAAPTTFSFCSMEPSFQAWGWRVLTQRPATEFLSMQGVSGTGLTLEGSGPVNLTTPPTLQPLATYGVTSQPVTVAPAPLASVGLPSPPYNPGLSEVSASQAAPCAPADGTPLVNSSAATASAAAGPAAVGNGTVSNYVADAAGRLHIAVSLGPAHGEQQYTPAQRAAEAADPTYWQAAHLRINFVSGPTSGAGPGGGAGAATPGAGLPNTATDGPSRPAAAGVAIGLLGSLASAAWRRRRVSSGST